MLALKRRKSTSNSCQTFPPGGHLEKWGVKISSELSSGQSKVYMLWEFSVNEIVASFSCVLVTSVVSHKSSEKGECSGLVFFSQINSYSGGRNFREGNWGMCCRERPLPAILSREWTRVSQDSVPKNGIREKLNGRTTASYTLLKHNTAESPPQKLHLLNFVQFSIPSSLSNSKLKLHNSN